MNIDQTTIATKVRGISQHQELMFKIMSGELFVEEVIVDSKLRVILCMMDDVRHCIGSLHSKYNNLEGNEIRVLSWRLTGGDPTDVVSKYGRLMKTIGMNLMLRVPQQVGLSEIPA
jgi:hypothetical protein